MNVHERAIELFRRGDRHAAELTCEHHLVTAPNDLATLSVLAELQTLAQRHERAAVTLARMAELNPRDAAAHRRLAGAFNALGRIDEAADRWRIAIAIDPANARAHNNLGQALMLLGQYSAAIASYQEALRLDPAYAIACCNLGLAYDAAGESQRASACFAEALGITPGLFPAWIGHGVALAKLDQVDRALDCFEQGLALQPDDASSAHVHHAKAGLLRRLGRRDEALQSLERALLLDAGLVDAWCDRATLLHELGRIEEAEVACRRAIVLDPEAIQPRTRLLARSIPSVPLSPEEADRARVEFHEKLQEFLVWFESRALLEVDALTAAQQQFFYLSYDEHSNRQVLQTYRGAIAERLARFPDFAPRAENMIPRRLPKKLRIGFLSAHVRDHSVFNAILRGWLTHVDHARFDISLFSVDPRADPITQAASSLVAHFDAAPRTPAEWVRSIAARKLDALIFPEIGMNETTLALASMKLAPRQFAAWGHPETSGLPTIDGFLSADLFEPPDADEHYCERLLRLPNLGVYCERYSPPAIALHLGSVGIVRDGPLFVCPGVPFKYRPQDDAILVQIARRLRCCTFVFFEYEIAELSHRLQRRMAARFEQEGLDPARHLQWIPWQPRAAFFGVLSRADVYLDTIGFSGFNTMMQAIECGLPCVTYEGRFMRGRLGSGILTRLGVTECIARSTEEYVDLAVTLGADVDYRAMLKAKMRSQESRLYADSSAIEALSRVLLAS